MMKAIFQILLIALGTLFNVLNDRVVEETYDLEGKEVLELDLKFADEIRIDTWDKNQVLINVHLSINDNIDNDKFQLIPEEIGKTLKLTEEIKDLKKLAKKRYVIEEDEDGRHVINGRHVELDIYYEIKIPEDVELKLETLGGDILVYNYSNQSSIYSISGFIDYSISRSEDVNFDLSTISGEMFSNLDLKIEGEGGQFRHVGKQDLEAVLNSGGNRISLKTISGNIYLREKEQD